MSTLIDSKPKFDFNDILLVPQTYSDITSRYKDIELPIMLPLFTAPMDTVVDLDNMNLFSENKINVVLPRTVSYNEYLEKRNKIYINICNRDMFVSFGFNEIEEFIEKSYHGIIPHQNILIDVANGHSIKVLEYCKDIKTHRPDITIMVGNIANPETYRWYAMQECVDFLRVGIGNGGACLSTKNSGIGFSIASLIYEIRKIKDEIERTTNIKPPMIVADGGMKEYSDIIKALALGADYVMVGSIFNKALESCADNYLCRIKINKSLAEFLFDHKFPIKKYFRGMSTKAAQKAMGKTVLKTSEGVTRFRNVEYHLSGWVENFEHYLRNAMSYSGAKTLDEFIGKAEFCLITKNAYDRFNK